MEYAVLQKMPANLGIALIPGDVDAGAIGHAARNIALLRVQNAWVAIRPVGGWRTRDRLVWVKETLGEFTEYRDGAVSAIPHLTYDRTEPQVQPPGPTDWVALDHLLRSAGCTMVHQLLCGSVSAGYPFGYVNLPLQETELCLLLLSGAGALLPNLERPSDRLYDHLRDTGYVWSILSWVERGMPERSLCSSYAHAHVAYYLPEYKEMVETLGGEDAELNQHVESARTLVRRLRDLIDRLPANELLWGGAADEGDAPQKFVSIAHAALDRASGRLAHKIEAQERRTLLRREVPKVQAQITAELHELLQSHICELIRLLPRFLDECAVLQSITPYLPNPTT